MRMTPIDDKKVELGIDVEYFGVKLRIARAANKVFKAKFAELMRPHNKQHRSGTLPDEVYARVVAESMAEGILVGWSGFTDENGVEIPYSKVTAAQVLAEDHDLRQFVIDQSSDINNFLEDSKQELVGKL